MFRLMSVLALVAFASAEIVYPCGEAPTRECIAEHMAGAAGCHPPEQLPTSDSWEVQPFLLELPFFRSTINRYKNTFEGIKDVENFILFTDSEADLTVLSWNFTEVHVYGRQQMQYHLPGEIDSVFDTSYKTTYNDIQVTVQWTGVETFNIGTGKVYSVIGANVINFEEDFPELAYEVAANPDGPAAQDRALTVENKDVHRREKEKMIGYRCAKIYRVNFLCDNYA